MSVQTMQCERCEAQATTRIEGERDSFGVEYIDLCDACAKKTQDEVDEYHSASDVEDRTGWFWVAEMTNYDGHGSWTQFFTSYRAAVSFLRKIERKADRWGGLYPGEGVRELASKEEYEDKRVAAAAARRRDREEEDRQDAEWVEWVRDSRPDYFNHPLFDSY